MPSPSGGTRLSAITPRAVCVGLLATILINVAAGYNNWYLQNTFPIGNHFPIISIVLVMVIVLGFNAGVRRWLKVEAFSAGELLLIWAMIGIGGGIGAAGVMRYFPSWAVVPAYYTTASNEFGKYVLQYLPDWMVVSKDPDSDAVKWFMEGLPRGASIPWGDWVMPMAAWGAFMLLLYFSNFALVSVFFQQWSVRERLIFPLVHLPLELAREAPKGKLLNEFLRNRATWIGVAIPALLWTWNGLRTYFPGLPEILTHWSTWGLFADRPWSEFNMSEARIYFSVIGLTFLLTTEIAFSLWFFYFLYRLTFVFVAWLGAGATGYWGDWNASISVFETTGAVLALAVFLFWTARDGFRGWLARALAARRDPEQDPIPPLVALVLVVVGLAGMTAWFMLAGAQWWASVIAVVLFVSIILVLTRLIAEAGLMFVQSNVIPHDVMVGLFPPGWISGFSLNSLLMHKAVLGDLREILMPYVMNGMKAASAARLRLGKVMVVFAVTAGVALAVSAYARIGTYYKYGGVNLDQWCNVQSPGWFLDAVAGFQKNPPQYDRAKFGDFSFLPVKVAHIVTGGALAAGMLVLRTKFLWWPLHPFGMVVWCSWAVSMLWFSIFIGWAAKAGVMAFGGASVYRKVLPLFLGFVLGESLVAAAWMLLGFITGTPGIYILPY